MMREALRTRYHLVLNEIKKLDVGYNDIDKLNDLGIIEVIQKIGGYKINWKARIVIKFPSGHRHEVSGKTNRQYKVFRTVANHLNLILKEKQNGN